MKRFFSEDPDDPEQFQFDDDDFGEDEDEEEEIVGYIDSTEILEVMQMDLAQTELNQHLVSKAMEIAKQSFWWRFKSTQSKLAEIESIYKKLITMTEDGEEEEKGK